MTVRTTVTQTFNNLAEGAIFSINGVPFQITYQGGTDNNDVVLTEIANFNVALDGGNLTFTDLLGNISDNMSLSFDGTNYILTNTSQLLFTQIAGAIGSGTGTVRVPATAVTGSSTILNGAGGADTLSVTYGLSNFVDAVTLNGGAGNDILRTTGAATAATALTINGDADDDTINLNADLTFVADSSMNVDLQDDTATPGTDSISVGTNANMVYSGSGAVELTASSISFATGSSIATANGNVVVETATLSLNGSIATSGGSLTLLADSLTISTNGLVDGSTNTVTIRPQSDGTAVNLGSDDALGSLGLTVSELNRVTAGTLVIGGFTSGSVTISADINRTVNTSVQLMSGDSIIQNSAAGSLNTTGGTLLLTPDSSGSHNPNRSGIDVTASIVSYTVGSSVTIDVSGNAVDSEYTQLNVSGTVSLVGANLVLTGSFTPAFGDTFVIVSATSIAGEFSSHADGSTFNFNGRTMRINYTATGVTLTDATAQAPVLTTPGSVVYTENDSATAIASGVVVSDADNATLASATVTITNFVTGEDVISFTNDGLTMGNIAISTNIGGVLTLTSASSTATKAEWQAALRSVMYANSSENPTTTDRSVEFVISDGTLSSNTLTSTISITSVNDAPNLVTLSPTTVRLSENSSTVSPTTLATIAVTDVDSGTNTLSLSGPHAAFFEIVSNELRLKAGSVLDFEATPSLDVTVEVNDAAVGGAVDASAAFTLTLTNVLDTTGDADAFTFTFSTVDVVITHAINGGTPVSFGSFPLNSPIVLNGLAADDSIRVVGTSGPDLFSVSSAGLVVNGTTLTLSGPALRTLVGGAGNDVYQFDADSVLGTWMLDESGGGTDTVDFSPTTTVGLSMNMAFDGIQPVHAINLSLSLGSGATFENAIGGAGADSLIGNSLDNTLQGGAGNDRLTGAAGSDLLIGGADDDTYFFGAALIPEADQVTENVNEGTDTLSFIFLTTSVRLHLGETSAQSVHTNRTLRLNSSITFENASGGSGADTLIGNTLNNALIGGAGDDTLNGAQGSDLLSGGANNDTYLFGPSSSAEADELTEDSDDGLDTLNFAFLTTDIVVNLGSNSIQPVHLNRTLRLNSGVLFENVIGGSGADTLFGNSLNNSLSGGAGNDRLIGAAGNDVLRGGANDDTYLFGVATEAESDQLVENANDGIDTLSFIFLTTDVVLNLGSALNQSVHVNRTVRLNSNSAFENATGGTGNDTLLGNASANHLTGGNGDNILVGLESDDILEAGSGRDILIGGPGLDVITGGAGEDILIAGQTTMDTNVGSLNTLRTAWVSTDTYEARIASLRAGVGSPLVSLKTTIDVLNDGGEDDVLFGGADSDWYFRALDDVITDLVTGEIVDVL
jgi:Ca2+-binding RTX toxin-like protein